MDSDQREPDVQDEVFPWPAFLQKFPIEYCRQNRSLGVLRPGGRPVVLLESRSNLLPVDVVGRALGTPVPFQLCSEGRLRELTNRFYEERAIVREDGDDVESLADALKGGDGPDADDLLESDKLGPVVRLVNTLLLDAIKRGASDVHIQPRSDGTVVRYRIDGVLSTVNAIPDHMREEVVSRLKVAGRMNIAEKRLPQDGRATVRVGDKVIDLRLASMPASFGERVVVRLLDKSARLYRLAELGMDEFSLERFRRIIHVEHGLVLVTGPTGSGKSTTLYSALQELDTVERNAVTLEDPIEYQLDGISQTQINTKKGMTFASGLRSVLRQDPDIIMVGEIRDHETAVMAVQAALTGHLVFSTLHTNDAASAITRLLDLGIEPYLVASSVLGVLAQRLVRVCCPACSRPGSTPDTASCPTCNGTGYRGREGIYELLAIDDEIRSLVTQRRHAAEIRDAAVAKGMRLLVDCGEEKIRSGRTTRAEVERVTMRAAL